MPPKGKSSSKSGGSKSKGADGDAESSSGKQAKGGTAVKVLLMLACVMMFVVQNALITITAAFQSVFSALTLLVG